MGLGSPSSTLQSEVAPSMRKHQRCSYTTVDGSRLEEEEGGTIRGIRAKIKEGKPQRSLGGPVVTAAAQLAVEPGQG